MAIDPVCGMSVDEKSAVSTRVHERATFYFCSAHCGAQFDANPVAYLKKTVPMTALNHANGKKPRNIPYMMWSSLTMLTCPCCIPIWIFLLSGTAAGALLSKNIYLTVAAFLVPCLYFGWRAVRCYGRK